MWFDSGAAAERAVLSSTVARDFSVVSLFALLSWLRMLNWQKDTVLWG